MQLIHLLKFPCCIVDLEKQSTLRSDIDSPDLTPLLERVGVIIRIFEVKNSEDSISCMVIQHDWSTGEMLILHSPESDILFAA